MAEKYPEKGPAGPESVENSAIKRLETVIDLLEKTLPDSVEKLTASDSERLKLDIYFTEKGEDDDSYAKRAEKKEFMGRLAALLEDKNLELGRMSGQGGGHTSFFVNEKTTAGKTNWRRWVHYPDAVSPEAQKLLDRIAGAVGQQKGYDSYEKFTNFYREARKRGLITEDEYETIHHELYRAANG